MAETQEKPAKDVKAGDELKAPKDNIGDRHDDGLWPDFDQSTESVRTAEAVDTGYAKGKAGRDTKVTQKKD